MKKLNKILLGIVMAMSVGAASAAVATSTLTITAAVPKNCSIGIGSLGSDGTVSLGTLSLTGPTTGNATLNFKCNVKNGVSISVQSSNTGAADSFKLHGDGTGETASTDLLTYQLDFGTPSGSGSSAWTAGTRSVGGNAQLSGVQTIFTKSAYGGALATSSITVTVDPAYSGNGSNGYQDIKTGGYTDTDTFTLNY